MEAWENPKARVDNLVLMASRAEVEAGDTSYAQATLGKLLKPENAVRMKGRLIFGIKGYDDDPRDLWEIDDVRQWMKRLDEQFPYWFYFMDLGPQTTMPLIVFSLCKFEKVPGGKRIPPEELKRFMSSHVAPMHGLSTTLGETQEALVSRARELGAYFNSHG
jgi:hypothetical protein